MSPARKPPTPKRGEPPAGFQVNRELELGRHKILEAFPGLDRLPTAARQEPDPVRRAKLHQETFIELTDADMWMYIAPREKLKGVRGWRPVVTPKTNCIVIGESHLRESPLLILFLDIYHELCHIQQRDAGADLFGGDLGYVERPTEIEAYRFVVDEARRLQVDDETLREYLAVEWVSPKELRQLLEAVGVPPPPQG